MTPRFDQKSLELTLAVNNAKLDVVLDKYNLGEARDFVVEFNKAYNLPYHNTKHCMTVARLCHDLLSMDDLFYTAHDYRLVICAALFHDFDHTGNDPDINNIENAVTGFLQFCAEYPSVFSAYDRYVIENIIRVTEFPFVHEPKTGLEKIIRDADVLQIFEPDHIRVSLYSLRRELEDKLKSTLQLNFYLEKQKDFVSGIQWYTKAAKRIAQDSMPALFASYDEHLHNVGLR